MHAHCSLFSSFNQFCFILLCIFLGGFLLIDVTPFCILIADSNRGPTLRQAGALTTELRPETHTETGDPAWLAAQLAGRWGQRNWNSVRWGWSLGFSGRYKKLLSLAALVSPVQNIFFPRHTLFPFMCPHRSASWSGRRAWSPVSSYYTQKK